MFISTQETVFLLHRQYIKAELTTVMCAVVRPRALMAQQAARLITIPPIRPVCRHILVKKI
jgi:hypothetical protein